MPKTAPLTCWDAALKLLAQRGHSTAELQQKLAHKGYSNTEIAPVVQQLLGKNWLNDATYALDRARYRAQVSGWGQSRIAQELQQKGIPEDLRGAALRELATPEQPQFDDAHDFTQAAAELLQRKFKTPLSAYVGPERAKESKRRLDFLARRGFTYAQAQAALAHTR